MLLRDLHRMHGRHLTALRRAPGTVRYYGDCVKRLEEFLESQGEQPNAELITKNTLMDFTLWLRERGLAPGGEHAVLRGVRASLKWAAEEELIGRDPTKKFKLTSPPKSLPPAIQPHEVLEVLKAAAATELPLRNKALLLTMLDTGVRMGELLQLRVEDVDLVMGMVRVRAETSKRQRERRVPFGIKTGRALTAYERKERRPASPHVQELFLNRSGMPFTKGGLEHLTQRLAERAGLPRSHVAPHAWRRAFATQCLRNGVDVYALREMMGHVTLEQSMAYLRYMPDDLQRQHLRASPVDRL